MSLQYPRLTHDEKRNTKLTLNEVQGIQRDFPKNPNFKIFTEKYNVAQITIKYWTDEEYRKKRIIATVKCTKERRKNDLEYKKHHQKLITQARKLREKIFFKIKQYQIKYSSQYNKKYHLENKEEILKQHKIQYQKNKKTKIIQEE